MDEVHFHPINFFDHLQGVYLLSWVDPVGSRWVSKSHEFPWNPLSVLLFWRNSIVISYIIYPIQLTMTSHEITIKSPFRCNPPRTSTDHSLGRECCDASLQELSCRNWKSCPVSSGGLRPQSMAICRKWVEHGDMKMQKKHGKSDRNQYFEWGKEWHEWTRHWIFNHQNIVNEP